MVEDRLNHHFGLHQYIVIPETHNRQALRFKITGALRIDLRTMLRTVKLDDQFPGLAIEIGDIGRDRMLAPEFEPAKSPASQAFPELALGIRRICTQLMCARPSQSGQWRFVHHGAPYPHPNPSPEGRGA